MMKASATNFLASLTGVKDGSGNAILSVEDSLNDLVNCGFLRVKCHFGNRQRNDITTESYSTGDANLWSASNSGSARNAGEFVDIHTKYADEFYNGWR